MIEEYVYSFDEEKFMDIDAISDEIEWRNEEDENIDFIYRGVKVAQTHKDFLCVDFLIEDMTERAYENFDEYSENYNSDLEDKKHSKELEKIILKYLDDNVSQPNFYTVKDIKEISIEEFKTLTNNTI